MKKIAVILLVLCLALGMLSACGGRSATNGNAVASGGNAIATDGNAVATDGNAAPADDIPVSEPTEAPTPEPPVTPEPGAETAPAADTALSDLLYAVWDEYRPGTAGSSLTALRLAAQIMDWYNSAGSTNTAYETAASMGDPGPDAAGSDYLDKLEAVYSAAVGLWGHYGESALADCGYAAQSFPYEMSDVKEVFDALYSGFGQGAGAPVYVRLFRSDDNAERFMVTAVKVEMLSPENVVKAMADAGVLAADVALNSVSYTESGMAIDLNAAFRTQLQSQGSSGEYMLMGALVNTFLQNYSAGSLTITVDGEVLESGHVVYDMPLTMYGDNVAVG